MRSPVESSMSSSRPSGWGETSWASAISESVVLPIAETVPTTRRPLRLASTRRCATPRTLSASATDDPPNFITTVSKAMSPRAGAAGSVLRHGSHAGSFAASDAKSLRRPAACRTRSTCSPCPRSRASSRSRPGAWRPWSARFTCGQRVAAEVLQPGPDLDVRRRDQLRAERAHRERDGAARIGVGIVDAELARGVVVRVEHRRDHVDVLADARDVLADPEVVVGREAEHVDAELDVERLERLARRREEARDRRVHGLA